MGSPAREQEGQEEKKAKKHINVPPALPLSLPLYLEHVRDDDAQEADAEGQRLPPVSAPSSLLRHNVQFRRGDVGGIAEDGGKKGGREEFVL